MFLDTDFEASAHNHNEQREKPHKRKPSNEVFAVVAAATVHY